MAIKHRFIKMLSAIAIMAIVLSNWQPVFVQAQGGDGIKRRGNSESGKLSFIGPENGRSVSAAKALGTFLHPQDPGMALAKRFAPEFGVKNPERDLSEIKSHRGEDGRLMVRYQQNYQGIPVIGGELIVNTNDSGDLYSMNGEISQDLSLSTQPTIDSVQARQTVLQSMAKWYQRSSKDFVATEPELWIFDESLLQQSTLPVELVWRMEVTAKDNALPVRELVLVNSQRGSVSLHFNQIDNAWTVKSTKPVNTTQDINPPATVAPTDTPLLTIEPSEVTEFSAATVIPSIEGNNSNGSPKASPEAVIATTWYVATTGNNGNSCSSAESPCATINGAIGKAATSGDTIKVAIGTYTDSGTEVVLINKSLTLSGGWNETFTTQSGISTIDGQGASRGVTVNSGFTAVIERIIVQNGSALQGGGIYINSSGILTLNNSTVSGNTATWGGGAGIYNNSGSTLTLNKSTIHGNNGTAINNYGTLTLNNSSVTASTNTGIFNSGGTLALNNSTLSGNTGTGSGGGGLLNEAGTTTINNSTISGNKTTFGPGGGIYNLSGAVTLKNTIIAGNSAKSGGQDCAGTIGSAGYNLIGNTSSCSFTSSTGDLININPHLGELIGSPAYYPLQASSSAIDVGNPAVPGSGGNACMANDERGITRPVGARCDIGAYEYTVPGSVASLSIISGDSQRTAPSYAFPKSLKIVTLDSQGSPVANVSVTFTAPSSGVSGTFVDTGTRITTVLTDVNGIAATSAFTANTIAGAYTVVASADGVASASFNLQNIAWYVSTIGSNSNNCQIPATPCETIDGVLGKVGFVSYDTILVAEGTYTGGGNEVVLLNKNVSLSGGWNPAFTTQNGWSIIDGQGIRIGMSVVQVSANVERFIFQNGYSSSNAGGIYNGGTLVLNNSIVQNNICCMDVSMVYGGAGISNWDTLTVNNSVIKDNISFHEGGGIYNNYYSTLTLNNTTVSGNMASTGAGISSSRTVTINNSTISGNWAVESMTGVGYAGGIYFNNQYGGTFTIKNSIVAGNWAAASGPDCKAWGSISSAGYNLIGNNSDCSFSSTTGDLIGTASSAINPHLTPLQDNGGLTFTHALINGSPAIDAGNPATCLSTDQRGVARPIGAKCDIGAYEGSIAWAPPYLIRTYTANNNPSATLPGTFICDQTDPNCGPGDLDAKLAHKYAIGTYNLYFGKYARNSIDGKGMVIKSTVHYCSPDPNMPCPYANANWTGEQMVYGDAYGYAFADDVVAHELTHGVTQYESNLFYAYQSGAINESFSDVWGEYFDQTNGQGNDTSGVKWLQGEDISGLGAIRSMSNPPAYGDPDKMSSPNYQRLPYDDDNWDNGGVHTNSGINNKAVFLMVDGGWFNGKTVSSLGWDKVGAIYHEVNTNLLTSGADYSDLYYAVQQACNNLIGQKGITGLDCAEVKDAIDAVEMNGQPVPNFNTDAPVCDAGNTPQIIFADDLENGTSNWTFINGNHTRWQYDSSYWGSYAQSGAHSLYADDYPAVVTDAKAQLIPIVIPANAYLWFAQSYEFESYASGPYAGNYDGGILEYSTNGGSTWSNAGSMMQYNGYKGSIYNGNDGDNPLKGKNAFVGSSHGYISTRLNLSSLAGKTVYFRWRMGLDTGTFFRGWWVDNVKVYTCTTFADVPMNYWASSYIERLYAAGITGGCATNPLMYCPGSIVTRDQMAVFLLKGKHGSNYIPPSATGIFVDVLTTYWAAAWIEQLAAEGITGGCATNPLRYCPGLTVTRDQMAVFLLKGKYGSSYVPPPATGVFADVPTTHWAAAWIEQLAAEGITGGCGNNNYCPGSPVTRDQMAVFLVKNFNLP